MRPPPRTGWPSPRPSWWWKTAAATTTSSTKWPTTATSPMTTSSAPWRCPGWPPERRAGRHPRRPKSGHAHDHGEFNEHVWYSLPAMSRLADAVAAKLGTLDPVSAAEFTANAAAFKSGLDGAGRQARHHQEGARRRPRRGHRTRAAVPARAAGLENRTPAEYTAAIEEGADVPPAVLKAADRSWQLRRTSRFLAYNEQTEGPQTEALKKAANAAGVPVRELQRDLARRQDATCSGWRTMWRTSS